ncbi:hypothetical protein ACFE04_024835 [Oxalis oulophora]
MSEEDNQQQNEDGDLNHSDSREDMFVDAQDDDDDFHTDTASRDSQHSVANVEAEKQDEQNDDADDDDVSSDRRPTPTLLGDHETVQGEKVVLTSEIADLRNQLKAFKQLQHSLKTGMDESVDIHDSKEEVGDSEEDHDVSLRDLINDCSMILKTAMDDKMMARSANKELNTLIYAKDQEIENLHFKVTEVSLSQDVTSSYMNSVQKVWSQSVDESSEKHRKIEVVTDRIMGYLASVVYQEQLLDNSVISKMASVEKNVYWLIERYNWMLYEVDQLKHCSSKVDADLNIHEAFGTVFAAARDEILELKTKSDELAEKLSNLEEENRKLVEQVDKEKVELETMNAELEREKTKSASTKEKLSMAVTKGKALVQQRDSLKQLLAEKTSELEKCLSELQEKSNALETSELCKEELAKYENLTISLQETLSQRDAGFEKFGEILSVVPEELQSMDITDKLKWLVDDRNELAKCKDELVKSENMATSLQEMLSQKNTILEDLETVLFQTTVPEELQSRDIIEKMKWLVDESNELAKCKDELVKSENMATSLQEMLSQKNTILEDLETVLFQTSVPEELQSRDIIEKMKLLVDERNELAGCKEELTNWENLVASLQETISQRNAIVRNFEEILSQVNVPEELQTSELIDKLKWLVDETLLLKNISLEYEKFKTALDGFLPDSASSSDLESRVGWVKESFEQSKSELQRLRDEITSITDSGRNEIDRLSVSLSAEIQEKDFLKVELADLLSKYNDITEKERLLTSKNDQMVRMLLEYSGLTIDEQEGVSDSERIFHKCFAKIKEQTSDSTSSPCIDTDVVEKMQSLLYEKDVAINLREKLLDDDHKELRSQVDDMTKELKLASHELSALKEEKVSLQKDVERAEEKSALLREKLTMAVKKGKGLVQDRENLKHQLDEKNSDIEKSRLELQQQESVVSECRNQISELESEIVTLKNQRDQLEQTLSDSRQQLDERISEVEKLQLDLQQQESIIIESRNQTKTLSVDLEQIPKLEADLVSVKDQKDHLEQLLSDRKQQLDEKNAEIEKLRLDLSEQESLVAEFRNQIDLLSTDLKHLPGLEAEIVATKDQRDQLEKFLLESNNMLQKIVESIDGIVLPVDLVFEKPVEKINWFAGFIGECQNAKTQAEEELAKAKEEADTLISKLEVAHTKIKSLEDTLSAAENNIAKLTDEKKQLEDEKANMELELQEAIEAARSQNSRFSEESASKKSLEDKVSALVSEKEEAQASRVTSEMELEKSREENSAKTVKLTEAYAMIKSLEESLSQAENNNSLLTEQNNNAQVGIIDLENALSMAKNEVSVLEDEKRVSEQEISILNSKLSACMEELAGTSGSLQSKTLELMGHLNGFQKLMNDESLSPTMKKCFEKKFESLKEMDLILKNIEEWLIHEDSPKVHPAVEEDLHMMKKLSADVASRLDIGIENGEADTASDDNLSSCFKKTLEEFHMKNKILLTKFEGLSTATDEFIACLTRKLQLTRDNLLDKFKHMESLKEKVKEMETFQQEQGKATAMVEYNVAVLQSVCVDTARQLQSEVNYLLELHSGFQSENVNLSLFPEGREIQGDGMSEHFKSLEDRRYVETAERLLFASKKIQNLTTLLKSTDNVVASLESTRAAFGNVVKERDLYQLKVSQLEADFKDKEQEEKSSLMSAFQLKTLFDKINGIEIPFSQSEAESSPHVTKLFAIIDCFNELQNQVDSLSYDKEELQTNLSERDLEIEHLKDEIETQRRNNPKPEKIKSELLELTFNLEKIIDKLGASEFYDNQKSSSAKALLTVLEKQATALLLDVENSKSREQELGSKLLASQQFVDELSTKVNSLEGSLQGRSVQPENVRERSIFELSTLPAESEISEMEDVGPSLVKNSISPAQSAAHIRTLRKGSTDHLALDIDSESTRLVNHEETGEAKGHVFKSLGTSGLIPKQGKLIADRIDSVWWASSNESPSCKARHYRILSLDAYMDIGNNFIVNNMFEFYKHLTLPQNVYANEAGVGSCHGLLSTGKHDGTIKLGNPVNSF